MMKKLLIGTVLALFAGCAGSHGRPGQPPDPDKPWQEAWARVAAGGEQAAESGEWAFEKVENGAVRAYRKTEKVAGDVGDKIEDAALNSTIKAKLLAHGKADIGVDVKDGVVILVGEVDSAAEAGKVVRRVVDTGGVRAVESRLTWH